ncbi:unnamed protein product [Ilex paraguariensis]|uniref:ribonuclease P n=1 Tax=Ilex paraguariensis TaxID=185542 RepID=A0ABC8S5S2_9AQUA
MDTTNHSSSSHHNTHKQKKKKLHTPEVKFRFDLDLCSKKKDLISAISLYEFALSNSIRLTQHHFNSLLYICSNSVTDPSTKSSAIECGFRIFNQMVSNNVEPNEATITAVARLAGAKNDGDLAFELVKSMGTKYKGVVPRLRTYGPAVFCFCRNGEADKAYEVDEHMGFMGIRPEEDELAALLKVSVEKRKEEKVYEYFHKLRGTLSCVRESTAEIIESWFGGEVASEVGLVNWDVRQVEEAVLRNGGGWHGQGWLGRGNWVVHRSNINLGGCCSSCGEQLVCVDIDREDTEKFVQSVASLAMERERQSNFKEFQDWLEEHSEYEAIIDGANVGLYQQNFADGGFSISQVDAVMKELYKQSKTWPLVVLHNKRLRTLLQNDLNRELIEKWMDQGVLYGTPNGSNDDWYWLYAAVKLKCLLVTNDEMRDHIFELLGSSFFLKWKERHQVRYISVKGNLQLQMPPSYSLVIQESKKGSWHVPLAGDGVDESSRTWICITRPVSNESFNEVPERTEDSEIGQFPCNCYLSNSCDSNNNIMTNNGLNGASDCTQICHHRPITITGKRKNRSPSPSRLNP